jgi:non-heme chloroperoxidase
MTTETTMREQSKAFRTSDGVDIAYSDDGTGEPVVLLAGFGCHRGHWMFQKQVLLDHGYRVIAMDFRFHGASAGPTHGQRISRLGADVAELIAAEDLRGVTMVTHSMGVSAALAYIDQHGTASLARLVAIDQSPRIMNDASWQWGVRHVTWAKLEAQLAGAEAWSEPGREPTPSAEVLSMIQAAGGIDDFVASPLAALKIDHFAADWRDVVPRLDVPLWVATGAHSPSFPVEGMEWFATTAPDGRLTVYSDSGHCPHWSESSRFNADLIAFLADTPVTRA